MLRVVVKRPGFRPVVEEIEPGLAGSQKVVGGPIELVLIGHKFFDSGDDLIVYANEDGRRDELELNFYRSYDGQDIVGTVVAIKTDAGGEDVSMTTADGERARAKLDEMSLPDDKNP